jgi:hypothetical protein
MHNNMHKELCGMLSSRYKEDITSLESLRTYIVETQNSVEYNVHQE